MKEEEGERAEKKIGNLHTRDFMSIVFPSDKLRWASVREKKETEEISRDSSV